MYSKYARAGNHDCWCRYYYYLGKKFKSWLTTFLLCTVLDLLVLQNAVSSGGKIFVKKEENIMRQKRGKYNEATF